MVSSPRAPPVSIACSVHLKAMPRALSPWMISEKSFIDRASRSILVTTKVSPERRNLSSRSKLLPAGACRAAGLLLADDLASGPLEGFALDRQVLPLA